MSDPILPDRNVTHYVDGRSCPEWGRASDGRPVKLKPDAELAAAFDEWRAAACAHADIVIHKRQYSNGGDFYRWMCRGCGIRLGNMIKHTDIAGRQVCIESVEYFDNIEARYNADRGNALENMADAAAVRMQPGRREEYSEYLSGAKWAAKRDLVMKRAGHTCEGCLSRPADHVHHLTYAHVGNEFAFELVAICRKCHERLHDAASI